MIYRFDWKSAEVTDYMLLEVSDFSDGQIKLTVIRAPTNPKVKYAYRQGYAWVSSIFYPPVERTGVSYSIVEYDPIDILKEMINV